MVLDSSALVAILLEEHGFEALVEKAGRAESVFVGAPVALEAGIVLCHRFRQDSRPMLMGVLRRLNAEIIEFGPEHYDAAMSAFLRFGKGRHPAALNFGDCMSYALASISGHPLLYQRDDFAKTDIQGA